ncbi:MAG: DUF2341 domain-containing protein, partial [Chloroflexota bacterium]|nr:DUF2341 domain-containing protein [Chloroflexota bacterium]
MLSSLAQADPGWGTDWEYRMLIEITDNSGSTLTDYQVPILIDTATFNYSKARPDGGDIRFGTTSGIDCDYWIEEWNATSESTIWVKVPSIPTSGTTSIYMYYGNASVTSTSNKNNTMNFFETGSLVSAGTIDEVGVYNISLTKSYDNPAVVAHVATRGGGQSIDVRARNVGSSSFEIFEEEPDDEAHNDETLNWIVAESGSWIGMDGQLRIEAGAHSTSSVHVGGNAFGGDSVSFDNSFNSTPSVLATINTYNNGAFMSTHTHGLTNTSFVVQQEAAETGKSASTETIGWIAFSGDAGTNDGINYEIGYHSQDGDTDGVDNTAESISYSFAGNPCLVVQGSTTGGSDGYWTRGAGTFSSTSANFYAEEDQVGDTERSHADEGFSWAAFYPQGSVVTVRKYASTEPTVNLGQEETTTSWTDYFGGTAAISASTNVDVSNGNVELGHIATEQIPFSDSFEIDLSNWDDNYATSWYIATNRFHDGSQSVRANNNNEGYLISDDIDLSDATSATIDFWFNKDDTEGQDFTLYFYDGSNWNLISELDGLGGDDVWLNYDDMSIDISTYGTSDFRIRFDATLGWGENVWVDQLTITKTTEQYSNAGSITSVSITPSNLQSWGTFSALDNNPTFCLNYSKTISITGTGTALTDYQVNIPVTYTSCMNADFSDLRFKDSSGTILSYWIESYVASTSAQVWVKVPSITASGTTTIYMYYGNAAASSASNGEDTFIFFD